MTVGPDYQMDSSSDEEGEQVQMHLQNLLHAQQQLQLHLLQQHHRHLQNLIMTFMRPLSLIQR